MAAEGGKTNKLAMHLDKIAYGSALVLSLFIILIPLFATTELNRVIRGLPEAQRQVAEKLGQEPPEIKVPNLGKIVHDQWEVSASPGEKWIPPWSIDARPAVVKLTKVAGKQKAVHEPGQIVKVSYLRDPKKQQVFLKIESAAGNLERAKLTKIKLLRAEVEKGAVGEFKQIAELKPDNLIYDDYQVEPGKLYAYRLVTEVGIDGDPKLVALEEADVKKESDPPLGMIAAVPYDFAIRILSATGATGTGALPSLTGEISFWDYETSKLVKVSKPKWAEKEAFGTKNRYVIFQIEDSKVVVNDMSTRVKQPLTTAANNRLVELPAELTPASADAANAPPPEVEPKKPAPKAEPEEKKTPKKPEGAKDKKTPPKDGKKSKRTVK